MNKRINELQQTINELEAKEDELQKTITGLKQQVLELRQNKVNNNILDPEIKQEEVILTNDVSIPSSNMITDYHSKEDDTLHYSSQIESSSRRVIFDTKDLFPKKAHT
jgi:hypothetical protein